MDVFNLKKAEILRLDYNEFLHMINYAWTRFNLTRSDLPYLSSRNKKGKEGVDYVSTGQFEKYRKKLEFSKV